MADEHTGRERLLSRISVAPPYFALEDVNEVGEILTATVPHAPTIAPETGVMAAPQVARHLAILGSCAAALGRDDHARHHYLATRADFRRIDGESHDGGGLVAEARAQWVDKRTVRAETALRSQSGLRLFELDCEYTVLAPRMFHRFNPPIDPMELELLNGDAESTELSFDVVETPTGVEVDCGRIPPSLCAGHFPDYPAAPVAILMGHLCTAAGLAMARAIGEPDASYRVESGHVEATGLARAGQRLVLRAGEHEEVDGFHRMRGTAEADGELVGTVVVDLSAHVPAGSAASAFAGSATAS